MKIVSNHNQQFVKAAADIAGMMIYASSGQVEIYEESYTEGEGDLITTWDFPLKGQYANAQELVNDIAESSGIFSNKLEDYVYLAGTLQTSALVSLENDEPTEEELAAWQNDEYELYSQNLILPVEVGSGTHEMTEDEAKAFGISIY
ncbi:hypothetical protein [Ruminococcus sp.]|uniref:hypothetical protein n=1 Tax=Ruminococcus sp. TaxID=41978 RepID=UPI001B76D2C8|nr:hypothetical protein [Ruminococcus sp.]MBP5433695.1 hypothetical protein [Ruminococcus sp.]